MDSDYDDADFPDLEFNDFPINDQYSSENINKVYLDCLRTSFGHTQFRPMQWKIISSIINRKQDNLAIMATGYGKSLCFQFPSVYLNTVTIIVSPLISLMEDQVLALTISNIKACLLGSAQTDKAIYGKVLSGDYRLVYVTPELITGEFGSTMLETLQPMLTLIAIDEAHCISKWGHDFRSAFRLLSVIRNSAPDIPILAMTATATEKVQQDIIKSLKLRNPQVLCTGFDRPNLEFNVSLKGSQGVWSDIGNLLKFMRAGSTIIYCLTRKQTEDIASNLQENGINCEAYHAGMALSKRKSVHENFARDKVHVIVATIAFGMGIDKPDVRQVIHYGASRDLESYYQEVGRAGRDGRPSKCFMFYGRGDFQFHASMRENNKADVRNNLDVLAKQLREYINTTECRRQFILQYFEGKTAKKNVPRKKCCDNCHRNLSTGTASLSSKYENLDNDGFYDFTNDAELLMKALDTFKCRTGLVTPILFLRGSKDRKVNEKLYTHEIYGKGKSKSDDWWKGVALVLEEKMFLRREKVQSTMKTFNRMQILVITKSGYDWMQSNRKVPLKLKLPKDMYSHLKVKKSEFLYEEAHSRTIPGKAGLSLGSFPVKNQINEKQELVKALLKVRASLASQLDIMPYMVCSNRALYQMADSKPMNHDEMRAAALDGFSDSKITKFGTKFIQCILELKNFLPSSTANRQSLRSFLQDHPMATLKITQTHLTTLDLWKTGKTVEQIAQLRGIGESTINSYMADLIRAGLCSTKDTLRKLGVDDKTFAVIEAKMPLQESFNAKLRDVKDKCPPNVTWDQLRIAAAYIQLKAHLKANNADLDDLLKAELEAKKIEMQILEETAGSVSQNQAPALQSDTHKLNESFFESDDDIDFTQIDEAIIETQNPVPSKKVSAKPPETTILPKTSMPYKTVSSPHRDKKGAQSLNKFVGIEDDQNENKIHNSQYAHKIERPSEAKHGSLKRKLIVAEKITFVESSSEDEDVEKKPEATKNIQPQKLPTWLTAKNAQTNKPNSFLSMKKFCK